MLIIDLSAPLNEKTACYPSDPPVCLERHALLEDIGYNVTKISTSVHAGTHVDAPLHFLPGSQDVVALPLTSFCGPGIIIEARKNVGENVELSDVSHAPIQRGDIVLFHTGWDTRIGTSAFFDDEWPGISIEVIEYLVRLGIKAIGVDSPSIDSPTNLARGAPAHKLALGAGLPIFEVLANLSEIAGQRCTFYGLPLKIEGAEASPIRAIAILNASKVSTEETEVCA
jgi:arylformamidase